MLNSLAVSLRLSEQVWSSSDGETLNMWWAWKNCTNVRAVEEVVGLGSRRAVLCVIVCVIVCVCVCVCVSAHKDLTAVLCTRALKGLGHSAKNGNIICLGAFSFSRYKCETCFHNVWIIHISALYAGYVWNAKESVLIISVVSFALKICVIVLLLLY